MPNRAFGIINPFGTQYSTMNKLYGIPNCDTVKKARTWLEQNTIAFEFIDLRKQPVDAEQWRAWLEQLGIDTLINKRSTSWKQLSQTEREHFDIDAAVGHLCTNPTLMKRPLLITSNGVQVGFKAEQYDNFFRD